MAGHHRITRRHEIHCGHRVVGHEGKCKNLHGHAYIFDLTCEAIPGADPLDELGRVIDFGDIKTRLCGWLENWWDHRMLLWDQDPMLPDLLNIDPTVVPVPFNPTAENIAQHVVETVGPYALAGTGVRLVAVTLHETSKCSATYERKE